MTDAFVHRPVMLDEIVEVFATVPAGVILDATLGGGGHSEAILERRTDLMVLGVDRDPAAIAAATARLERFGDRFRAVHARFDDLQRIMTTDQLPRPTAADVAAHDARRRPERRAVRPRRLVAAARPRRTWLLVPQRRAARHADGHDGAVVGRRRRQRLRRRRPGAASSAATATSASPPASPGRSSPPARSRPPPSWRRIVTAAIPAATRRTGGHPATRTFQAIRIEVNAELDALPVALDAAIEATRPGGRIAVLSYHSGEDRIAKERFRLATGACDCPPGLPCVCGAVQTVRLVRGVPKRASEAERAANPRAASARLRVAERLAED